MTWTPDDFSDMAGLRAEIDRIDRELVTLMARRVRCIDRAIELKTQVGWPARIDARVEEVVSRVRAEAEAAGLDAEFAEALWRRVIEWSIAREERVLGEGGGNDG
jgi:isochorismate pyruvate lyase